VKREGKYSPKLQQHRSVLGAVNLPEILHQKNAGGKGVKGQRGGGSLERGRKKEWKRRKKPLSNFSVLIPTKG